MICCCLPFKAYAMIGYCTSGTKVSNGTKTLSIIEVLRIKAEGQVSTKNREMDLREREIALAECRMQLEERKYEDMQRLNVPQPQQFRQVGDWQIN